MPSKSKAQQRLMAAAEHGADFPLARQIQESMSLAQMRDFSRGPMTGKPEHIKARMHGHPHKNLGTYLHKPKGRK